MVGDKQQDGACVVGLVGQVIDHILQPPAGGEFVQGLVELTVNYDVPLQLPGTVQLLPLPLQRLGFVQTFVGEVGHAVAQRQALHLIADKGILQEVVKNDACDHETAVGDVLHQVLVFQQSQRLPHGDDAHIILRRQLADVDFGVGRQFAAEDVVPYPRVLRCSYLLFCISRSAMGSS